MLNIQKLRYQPVEQVEEVTSFLNLHLPEKPLSVHEVYNAIKHHAVFVATLDTLLVGVVTADLTEEGVKLKHLLVDPPYRSRGIGGKLVDGLVETIRQRGASTMQEPRFTLALDGCSSTPHLEAICRGKGFDLPVAEAVTFLKQA